MFARAPLGGRQLIHSVKRVRQRSAMGCHRLVKRRELLTQHVEALFRTARPERQALAGRNVSVQRRTQIEEGFKGLTSRAIVRDTIAKGTAEGGLVFHRSISQSGSDEQTDDQHPKTIGLAVHRLTE